MTRHLRLVLPVWALIWLCAAAPPAAAHDGVHTPDVLVRVGHVNATDQQVNVRLTLTGLGGPLMLRDMFVLGASARFDPPPEITFAADVIVDATLTFIKTVPARFMLGLDFGDAGVGQIAVMTDRETR